MGESLSAEQNTRPPHPAASPDMAIAASSHGLLHGGSTSRLQFSAGMEGRQGR